VAAHQGARSLAEACPSRLLLRNPKQHLHSYTQSAVQQTPKRKLRRGRIRFPSISKNELPNRERPSHNHSSSIGQQQSGTTSNISSTSSNNSNRKQHRSLLEHEIASCCNSSGSSSIDLSKRGGLFPWVNTGAYVCL
ncbi:unnamed protein product, partial [Pylaiella littoralis]